jgi:hypothetical protein
LCVLKDQRIALLPQFILLLIYNLLSGIDESDGLAAGLEKHYRETSDGVQPNSVTQSEE